MIQNIAQQFSVTKKTFKRDLWWTEHLENIRKYLKRLKTRTRRATNPNAKFNYYCQSKIISEIYRVEIKRAQTRNWKLFCEETKRDTFYSTMGKIMKRSATSIPPAAFLITGTTPDVPMEQFANRLLMQHFPDNHYSRNIELVESYTNRTNRDDNIIVPFTDIEYEEAINSFKPNKSPGADCITVEMLKNDDLSSILLELFNQCMQTSFFPTAWKIAIVKVIPKPAKNNYSDPKSYRPIGLLSVVGKLLEKMMSKRILHDLHSKQMVSKAQYGFTPERSSVDALIEIVSYLKSRRKKGRVIAISLDIQGAFDNIQWGTILRAARHLNFADHYVKILQSYLSQRKAQVWYESEKVTKTVTQGCVQGSVLGPLMWNLVLDQLLVNLESENIKVVAFADDVTIMVRTDRDSCIQENINKALQIVDNWGKDNMLAFSAQKTQMIQIGPNNSNIDCNFQGLPIDPSNCMKVLGLTIDTKLNFEMHSKNLVSKVAITERFLRRIAGPLWGMDTDTLMLIYKTIIEKIVMYASPVWAKLMSSKGYKKLHQLQRRCLIRVTKAYRTTSYHALYLLSGQMDWCSLASQELKLYEVKYLQTTIKYQHEKEISFSQLPPPYERIKSTFTIQPAKREHFEVYTDGSKMDDGVGSAAVLYAGCQESTIRQKKLPDNCSVYQAELVAIQLALEIQNEGNIKCCAILSDSKSSLQSLENPSSRNPLIVAILKKIADMRSMGFKTNFGWVRAHVGLTGNERADTLAKEAIRKGSPANILPPLSWAKYVVKNMFLKEWSRNGLNKWYKEGGRNTISSFIKYPAEMAIVKRYIPWTEVYVWLMTGHGPMKAYLTRFAVRDDETCECQAPKQDSNHLLFRCQIKDIALPRNLLRKKARFLNPGDFITAVIKAPTELHELITAIGTFLRSKAHAENQPTQPALNIEKMISNDIELNHTIGTTMSESPSDSSSMI